MIDDMRTTVTLDDALIARAMEMTGITERSALVRHALERLVQHEAGRRLAALGGSDPHATAAPRRRGE
ncbi:type II toxin-antitoxin system VapB family antitoxin [Gryllotalpicola protaetiae]|nr:type II toxin-antitoxin system VapB family antitoxin [Gryllotalpicola protaetiae]